LKCGEHALTISRCIWEERDEKLTKKGKMRLRKSLASSFCISIKILIKFLKKSKYFTTFVVLILKTGKFAHL